MRRVFTRLSKTLLVFALSVGALRADERPNPFATPATTPAPAATTTPAEKPLRAEDANVKELLDRVGYPFTVSDTTAGTKAFWITGSRGDLDFKIRVAVSPNGAMVWLNTVVSEVKDAESVAGRHYLALLEENHRINPAMFTYSGKDKYIRLMQCFAYNKISAQYLREEIDIHLETLHTTRKLWDSANWSHGPVAQAPSGE